MRTWGYESLRTCSSNTTTKGVSMMHFQILLALLFTSHPSNQTVIVAAEELPKSLAVRKLDVATVFGGKAEGVKVFAGKSPDYRAELCKKRARNKPEAIRSTKELHAIFGNVTIRKRISSQVDFDKEQLILVAWAGTRSDKPLRIKPTEANTALGFYEPKDEEVNKVAKNHIYLYAIGKNVRWFCEKEHPKLGGPLAPPITKDLVPAITDAP